MSNHFPPVPADFVLASITYMVSFGGPLGGGVPFGSGLTFDGALTGSIGALAALGGEGGIQFIFAKPGSFGSFDQDAAEAALTQVISAIFSLMSVISGDTVSALASQISIARNWAWTDDAGNQATYTDTMPLTLPAAT